MSTIKVAIADDNRELVHQIEAYFQNHAQIEIVATASNGEVCLTMLEEHDIDLLLLDLIMPYMDGIAVLEHIRASERYAQLPIMMLTAFGQEKVMKNIVDLGVTYLILKPFDFIQLESKILRWARSEAPDEQSLAAANNILEDMSSIDVYIDQLLKDVGIPMHIRGYKYLRKAVLMVYDNPRLLNGAITTMLYPGIAEAYGSTGQRVERAIRHAIEVAWSRDTQAMKERFQSSTSSLETKPKNSEFIALIVTCVQQQFIEKQAENV